MVAQAKIEIECSLKWRNVVPRLHRKRSRSTLESQKSCRLTLNGWVKSLAAMTVERLTALIGDQRVLGSFNLEGRSHSACRADTLSVAA